MDNFYQFEEAMNKFKLKKTKDSTINEQAQALEKKDSTIAEYEARYGKL